MSNYIEHSNKIAFHPGFYIKEIIEDSGLTQEEFAKRLDTTPKNLSLLVRGKQSLSVDIAMKLSRMLGTSTKFWLNLQNTYDEKITEFNNMSEKEEEKEILRRIGYKYFQENFGLPKLPRDLDAQVDTLRKFLKVASLTVLKKYDLTASYRSASLEKKEDNIIKANAMMQIAINEAIATETPAFNKKEFETKIEYALSLTHKHEAAYEKIKVAFQEAGVVLVVLPSMKGSKINGATKKIGEKILLLVSDRGKYADVFWFTLFHEIGHIEYGDYGISVNEEKGHKEKRADEYARDRLIPKDEYELFVRNNDFTSSGVKSFATSINRDPGLVVGRLFKEERIQYTTPELRALRRKIKIASH